jgi:hypothetical protein
MATTKVNGSRSSLETSLSLQDLLDSPGIFASIDLTVVYPSAGAVAAAVVGSPQRVRLFPLAAAERFPALLAGRVDLIAGGVSWTLAREAGHRTKIAVKANDPSVNAKGSCIGEMGRRVRAVTEELAGEKIDIVDYSTDICEFVAQALSPAKVSSAYVIGKGDPKASGDGRVTHVRALVPDYQLSLAIGKEGQNVRLAAKLTGAKIDVQPESILEGDD